MDEKGGKKSRMVKKFEKMNWESYNAIRNGLKNYEHKASKYFFIK